MKKIYPLLSVLFLIIPLSVVHSQKRIGIIDGVSISGKNLGLIDGVSISGKNVFLTDSYFPKNHELNKVYILSDGFSISGDNYGLIDGVSISGDNYGFTNRPESSDIIIVVDLDLIIKILSDHSVFKTIIKNYNSSDGSNSVKESQIDKISDDYNYIQLFDGSVYYTINLEPYLWLEYSSVIVIGDKKLIYEPNGEIIDVMIVK